MITKQELETIRNKTPFLSEGFISPSAIAEMGKREKKEYFKNVEIRFKAEEEFKEQNKTDMEKEQDKKEREQKVKSDRIIQLKAQIRVLADLPQIKSKKNNKTKTLYNNYLKDLEVLKGG